MSAPPYIEHVHRGSAGAHVDGYRRMLARWAESRITETGPFGAASVALVRDFQRAEVPVTPTGAIGPATHAELVRWADDTACELLQGEYQRRHPQPSGRQIVAEAALLALTKRGTLTYSGRGRATVARRWEGIDNAVVPPDVPLFADCSSLSTWCLWLARDHGATDPSAREWTRGSTDTMELHGRAVDLDSAQPGDLFFYSGAEAGGHVTLMVERVRGVPFVVSFGSEGGPSYVRYDYRRALWGLDDLTSIRSYIT